MNGEMNNNRPSVTEIVLNDWRSVIGNENVQNSADVLAQYSRTTGAIGTVPLCVLTPESVEEVQAIVRIAGKYKIALYPISRGKNYGYGDACAPTNGQAILDFKRMNRILEVNKRLGYVVIEPGVSQGQLYKYLNENRTGLWMDATGAGPEASLVGNALERGYGHTHYGDHTKSMCGLQVVLADGQKIETGFGQFSNSKAKRVYSHGIGPDLNGIFAQSNLGIVTQMTLLLSPEPEAFSAFICWIDDDKRVLETVDILSDLKMRGVLQSNVHIGNDLRVISSRGRFPWDKADGNAPMPENIRAGLRNKYGARRWAFTGAIYGTEAHVRATRKTLEKAMAPNKVIFMNDKMFEKAQKIQNILGRIGLGNSKFAIGLKEKVATAKPLFDLLKGRPTQETLKGAAWKTKGDIKMENYEPLAAGSGILWQAPVLPATSENVKEILGLLEPIYHKYGFDCPVTFSMINDRALACVTNVSFDKKDEVEMAQALLCHAELHEVLVENGYYSYRTSAQGAAKLHQIPSTNWDVLSKIKKALDPEGILSPGHYIPRK